MAINYSIKSNLITVPVYRVEYVDAANTGLLVLNEVHRKILQSTSTCKPIPLQQLGFVCRQQLPKIFGSLFTMITSHWVWIETGLQMTMHLQISVISGRWYFCIGMTGGKVKKYLLLNKNIHEIKSTFPFAVIS